MRSRAEYFGGGFGHGLGQDATKVDLISAQPSGALVGAVLSWGHGHKTASEAPAF